MTTKRNSKVYRKLCFKYHKHQCVCCHEKRLVTVHHLDGNYMNNMPSNLIPLCPTCHAYVHSTYKYLKMGKILAYINIFRAKHSKCIKGWYKQYYQEEVPDETKKKTDCSQTQSLLQSITNRLESAFKLSLYGRTGGKTTRITVEHRFDSCICLQFK